MKTVTKLWVGLAALIILSPLGLILPERFKAGTAWGEWGTDEIRNLVGYIPQGLQKLSNLWNAPLSDYSLKGWGGRDLGHLSIAYIFSAVLGIAVTVAVMYILGRLLTKNQSKP